MLPGDFSVVGIKLDLRHRQHRTVMLQMKAFARPNRQSFDHLQTRSLRIIGSEPNQIQPRSKISCRQNVSLFQRSTEESRNSTRNFSQISDVQQSAEHEALRHSQFPERARALIAKDFSRKIEEIGG